MSLFTLLRQKTSFWFKDEDDFLALAASIYVFYIIILKWLCSQEFFDTFGFVYDTWHGLVITLTFFPILLILPFFWQPSLYRGQNLALTKKDEGNLPGTYLAGYYASVAGFASLILLISFFGEDYNSLWWSWNLGPWLTFWDVDLLFTCDALSAVFLLLTHFLLVICIFLMVPTLAVDSKAYLGIGLLVLLWFQLVITFLAADLFLFFVAFESLMIPLLFLIGIWGSPNRLQANNYLYFYTAVGATGMLLSILYLWRTTGTTSLITLNLVLTELDAGFTWSEKTWLWLGFFLSFAIKTPVVPFHIWLPKAHVEAPTTGSVLLAGLLLKIGLYGLLRICLGLFPDVSAWVAPLVSTLAVIGIIYASLITLRQIDMKRIIAYSSVAHMSLALASVMTGDMLGISAGVYLSLSHGIVSSSLFILVGALYARFHNRLVIYYGGLVTWMTSFSLIFFFFSLANMAFPLTSGFMGEFLCLTAILAQNSLLGVLAATSMLFSTVYVMLLFNRVFLGNLKLHLVTTTTNNLRNLDLTVNEFVILAPCVVLTVYFGIFPSPLLLDYVKVFSVI
jgi:proton-translocating NADH-quinone oxidoreductase chain M